MAVRHWFRRWQLGMPMTTVSSKLAALEKRLRTTLIKRTTRQLHATYVPARLRAFIA
jgi:DNA-binding transcriptional LysR family regulator